MSENTNVIGSVLNKLPSKYIIPYITTLIILGILCYSTFFLFENGDKLIWDWKTNKPAYIALFLLLTNIGFLSWRFIFNLKVPFSKQKDVETLISNIKFPIIIYDFIDNNNVLNVKLVNFATMEFFGLNLEKDIINKNATSIYSKLKPKLENPDEWFSHISERVNKVQSGDNIEDQSYIPAIFKDEHKVDCKKQWNFASNELNLGGKKHYFTIIIPEEQEDTTTTNKV